MWRTDSLEKTLMLGKTEGRKRRGQPREDGWMALPTQWTWVWASCWRWWRAGKPGMLHVVAESDTTEWLNDNHVCVSCSVVFDSLRPHGLYIACQAPLSMGFSRQEYWSGLPVSSPGDLPDPGIEPGSSTLQADSLPSEPPDDKNRQGISELPFPKFQILIFFHICSFLFYTLSYCFLDHLSQ